MSDVQVPPVNPVGQNVLNLDQLYRDYGEATVQAKIANGRVMQIEQTIQQILNQQQANLPKA